MNGSIMTIMAEQLRTQTKASQSRSFTTSVGFILQRQCACGGSAGFSGTCAECQQNKLLGKPLQTKLQINEPGDHYEQEADRMAEQIMRMPDAEVNGSRHDAGFPLVLRRATGGAAGVAKAPPIVHEVLNLPGRPLDSATRAFFEPRFGHDFSRVRVHAGERAEESARDVNAHAYTVGHNIVFGAGRYSPYTAEGRRLLAHELAHVSQQSFEVYSASSPLRVSEPSDHLGRQADSVAREVTNGCMSGALSRAPRSLSRQPAPAAKKCPTTHTIPNDVYKALGEAWRKSGQAGTTVTEHGGRIVTDSAGKRVIRTGSGGGGSISLPAVEPGDVTLGTFHTHPYSRAEGSQLGVSFSGGDIENFIAGDQGSVKYVHAGSCVFVLDTLDASARDGCKAVDIKQRWDDQFAKAGGNFQLKVDAAVRAAIKGCGMCYYGTCRPDVKGPIPRTANLA
jgi:hypothetical protein